jgi:prophage tail gpP-like protein
VQPFPSMAPRLPFRPLFLHDEESKTQEQLNFFVKRTMSELLRKSLVCHYTVEGHGQNVDGVFVPWDIDRVVEVHDEPGGVDERMWIIGRTFEKSRSGGTFTRLELVRLYSIASGNQEELKAKPGVVANTEPTRPPTKHIREQW